MKSMKLVGKGVSCSEQVGDGPSSCSLYLAGHVGGSSLPVCISHHVAGSCCQGEGSVERGDLHGALHAMCLCCASGVGLGPAAHTALCTQGDLTSRDCWLPPVVHGVRGAGLSATLDMLVVICGTLDLHRFLFLSQAVHS